MREAWDAALGTECAECGRSDGYRRLILHHVVYRQAITREKGDLWDPRNALTVCSRCHERHHSAWRRIRSSSLTDENFDFACELLGDRGLDYIARRYGGDDHRID